MGRSQNINIHKSLEEIDSLMDGFEGFTILVEEVIPEVVKIVRELESELKPEDGTEFLQSHYRSWMGVELFLMDEQRKFLSW